MSCTRRPAKPPASLRASPISRARCQACWDKFAGRVKPSLARSGIHSQVPNILPGRLPSGKNMFIIIYLRCSTSTLPHAPSGQDAGVAARERKKQRHCFFGAVSARPISTRSPTAPVPKGTGLAGYQAAGWISARRNEALRHAHGQIGCKPSAGHALGSASKVDRFPAIVPPR